jgi:hypothetical protein
MIVSAVHPWLLNLRGDILEAKYQADLHELPMEFMVSSESPDQLKIQSKEKWFRRRKPKNPMRATREQILVNREEMFRQMGIVPWSESTIPR